MSAALKSVKRFIPGICAILGMALLLSAGCGGKEEQQQAAEKETCLVFASNYPLAYFAEQISGRPDLVWFPEIDGDPAFWKPGAEQIARIQRLPIRLMNGATYEKWAFAASLPESGTYDTTAHMTDQLIHTEGGTTHSHGMAGEHSHGGTAFTTWLDLLQARSQAEAVRIALHALPELPPDVLDRNARDLRAKLKMLDRVLLELTSALAERPLLASHPVYQYFARRYRLNLRSVLWEPDTYPDDRMWMELQQLLEAHPAGLMIWEDAPLPETAEKLRALGVESVVFNPCGNRPDSGDFMTVMEQNIKNLEQAISRLAKGS